MIDVRTLDAPQAELARERLAEILAKCVSAGASVNFMWPFTIAEAHDWWAGPIADVAAGQALLFGAYADGVLIGTVQLSMKTPPNQRHRGDVRKLLVHPDSRRMGAAAALMGKLESAARERELQLLTLDTATGSGAEALYLSLGWHAIGFIPNFALYPDGRPCDATFFWKELVPR